MRKNNQKWFVNRVMLSTIAIVTSLCTILTAAAAPNDRAMKSDSLANVLIKDGKYEDALRMLNRAVSAMDENHPDSLYVQSFVKMGYCYDRLEQPMKSIEMTKMAIFLREEAQLPENVGLANLYDNIALAYHKIDQHSEAQMWSQKALRITVNYPKATEALIRHRSHASMIAKALGQLPEAIEEQKQVITLVESSRGKYSELHLEHLAILRQLYNAQGDTTLYGQTSRLIRQLKDEITAGVRPEPADLSSPRLCRQHNQDALLCCRWILSNYVTTQGMNEAVAYLTEFYKHTPDVAIYVSEAENEWAKKLNSVYLMAYIAASCDYALRNPDDLRYSVLQYKYAMNRVLDYYEENKKITGTIPTFDSYLRQRKHAPENFDKQLSKNFSNYCNQMKSKRPYEFDIKAPTIMTFSY